MARIFRIRRGPKERLPLLAQGELAMTTDPGSEFLWLGTGSRNKPIPLDPIAADVGAVSKDGDIMEGALGVNDNHGNLNANASRAQLRFNPDPANSANATSVGIYSPANGLTELARIYTILNGAEAQYNILHTGNKPKGTYTGNGSAAERKIPIGGIGSYLLIHADTFNTALITPNGRINFVYSTGSVKVGDGAKFENGVLTLTVDDGGVNAGGRVYHYQVL